MLQFSLILESFEIKSRLNLEPITHDEALKLIDEYGFTIFDDIDKSAENIPDFYTTNHYKIMIGDVFAGIIGFNNFYDTWKDFPDRVQDGRGKQSLWVQMLEIRKEARNEIGSPLAIIKGVFDYLCDYCKENDFKTILCGAKTERIAQLYKRVGFIGRQNLLVYFVK